MLKRLVSSAVVSLALAAHAATSQSVTLDIKGMDCAACPITIKTVLEKQPGVSGVHVDFRKATAAITFDPAKVSPQRLAQVVTEAGYPSTARK